MSNDVEFNTRCPYCGYAHDRATDTSGASEPRDGDVSLCVGCGSIGIFDAGAEGGIRRTTPLEAAQLSADTQVARVRLAWKMMNQKRRAEQAGRQP